MAPPVETLERAYSLEEVRDNYLLRQRLRHIELVNINFEFGAWEMSPEQYPKLERLARAMLRILRRNPDEAFLIGGHTDAVGSDVDNLSLSDRRAAVRRRGPVGDLRRAAGEPRHPGLRRAVPEGRHAGGRAAQPPRRRAPHHPADGGAAVSLRVIWGQTRRV